MCGRFALSLSGGDGDGEAEFGVALPAGFRPRYNIAPTQEVFVVIADDAGRRVETMRWGLIPAWADDPSIGNRLINARAESIFQKPSFKRAAQHRRCLVPADGFYEWQRQGGRKVPHFVRLRSGRPFGFAGIWDAWRSPEGESVLSCTIVTTEANDLLKPIHDRMPVIVPKDDEATWLDPKSRDRAQLASILQPYPSAEMEAYPVSTLVNAPANDVPECLRPRESDA